MERERERERGVLPKKTGTGREGPDIQSQTFCNKIAPDFKCAFRAWCSQKKVQALLQRVGPGSPECPQESEPGIRFLPWALVVGPFDSGGICFFDPLFGISLVCIRIQIRGPCQGPIRKALKALRGSSPALIFTADTNKDSAVSEILYQGCRHQPPTFLPCLCQWHAVHVRARGI